MRTHIERMVSGVICALVLSSAVLAQDAKDEGSKAPPTEAAKPDLEATITAAEAALKAKDVDAATKALIDLMESYKAMKPEDKERKRIVDVVGRYLRSPEAKLQKSGADSLGGMGTDGAKLLKAALSDKEMKDKEHLEIRCAVIENLGRTKEAGEAKTLLNLLKDKDNEVIAAAAKSLAHYNDGKEALRKEITKEMVNILDSAYNGANDPKNTTAVKKFEAIRDPMMTSLQAITGASVGNAGEWRAWYNKNKNTKW